MAPLENAADVEKIFSDVDSSGSILLTPLPIWRDLGSHRINQALTMFRQAFIANAVGGLKAMTDNLTLTRLVDRRAIEIVVDALLSEGFSRDETVLAIVHDIPTDLDILNEVLDTLSHANKSDGSNLIH